MIYFFKFISNLIDCSATAPLRCLADIGGVRARSSRSGGTKWVLSFEFVMINPHEALIFCSALSPARQCVAVFRELYTKQQIQMPIHRCLPRNSPRPLTICIWRWTVCMEEWRARSTMRTAWDHCRGGGVFLIVLTSWQRSLLDSNVGSFMCILLQEV